jgi:cytochrome c oxidase cbb3-type subunit I
MWDYLKLVLLGLIAVLMLYLSSEARDLAYLFAALTGLVSAAVAFIYTLRGMGGEKAPKTGYLDGPVRIGVILTAFWAVIGFTVGTWIAFLLAFPNLNYEWAQGMMNFGRLRPLHTSAVIFAFGGTGLVTTSMYVVQRTTGARLWNDSLAWFVFWGYQITILLAATGYVLGATQSKEYAEFEWYTDWWLTIVWVGYLLLYMGTLMKRKEPHIYVANWFYLSFIVTIAMLHVVNNLSVPVSLFGSKSVQVFSGVQDAMTQWWYGHNAGASS